jgi:hypothetical protein
VDQTRQADVRKLVTDLGGASKVAADLDVTPAAVGNWYVAGIPARHYLALWRLAQSKNLHWRPPGAEGLALPPFIRATSSDHTTVMPGSDQVDSAA